MSTLFRGKINVTGSPTPIYVMPASNNGFVSMLSVYNPTIAPVTCTVSVLETDTTVTTLASVSIVAGDTMSFNSHYDVKLCPINLNAGEAVQVQGAGLVARCSGLRFTI